MSKFRSNLDLLVNELGSDYPSLMLDLARTPWESDEDLSDFIATVKGVA